MQLIKKIISIILAFIFTLQGGNTSTSANLEIETKNSSISNLKVLAEKCNVYIGFSDNNEYTYDYDTSKFNVTTTKNDSTIEITINPKTGASIDLMDGVAIYIPNQTYDTITAISEKAGLTLSEVNSNINLISNKGSTSLILPNNYDKIVNYTSISGSGGIKLNKDSTNYIISMKVSKSAVSIHEDFPQYIVGSSNYEYKNGDGTAKINIDIKSSSFTINK